jgi:NAD+ synthetase
MKIQNLSDGIQLSDELQNELEWYRHYRKFVPKEYLDAKASMINRYFREHNIKGVVVGVSGGIDSVLVLAIFHYIKTQTNSPLIDIIPAILPYSTLKKGTSGQASSKRLATKACNAFNLKPVTANLSDPIISLQEQFEQSTDWATGQLVTNLRTPVFYFLASANSEKGNLTVVSGTTNLDEGAYIGYFAKVGDCMVDIQPISDLHKSEVVKLAKYLGVPNDIINAIPKGDVFDNRSDEQMIGTSYDFVELYFHLHTREERFHSDRVKSWTDQDHECYNRLAARIEKIHSLNSHKYIKGSNAIHFDVMPSNISKGWCNQPILNLNIGFTPPSSTQLAHAHFEGYSPRVNTCPTESHNLHEVYEDVLTASECKKLSKQFEALAMYNVGPHGGHLNEAPIKGSTRSKTYDIPLAKYLFGRYQQVLPSQFKYIDPLWAEVRGVKEGYYRPVAINPYFRFMKYKKGDLLLPHYDSETHFGDQFVTLDSIVLYLSDSTTTGATTFVSDPQHGLNPLLWSFEDHNLPASNEIIYKSVFPHMGRMLVFDHRLLHAGDEIKNAHVVKKIVRTDLIYQYLG